jgi:hypothetical protein
MIAAFQIRKGATAPWLEVVLTQSGRPIPWEQPSFPCPPNVKEAPIDLTGMTVKAKMYGCGRTQPEHVVFGITSVKDAVNGVIIHKWDPEDTADVGYFMMSFEVSDSNTGAILMWPYLREQFMIEVTP